jgi:hypothetical protein
MLPLLYEVANVGIVRLVIYLTRALLFLIQADKQNTLLPERLQAVTNLPVVVAGHTGIQPQLNDFFRRHTGHARSQRFQSGVPATLNSGLKSSIGHQRLQTLCEKAFAALVKDFGFIAALSRSDKGDIANLHVSLDQTTEPGLAYRS